MKRLTTKVDTWAGFKERFAEYQMKPSWNHWANPPDSRGNLARRDIEHIRNKGQRAVERLAKAIDRLQRDPDFSSRPSQVSPRTFAEIVQRRLLPKLLLNTFWQAVIFDRDEYTCQYCRRSVSDVWQESNSQRTIGLTCDHRKPRSSGAAKYSLRNTKTACWSCNGIKSTLPESVLHLELRSLARAVSARSPK